MIVSGYKVTGKRQIQGFHIAGDIPDLQSLPLRVLDNSVGTITQAEFGDALGLPAVYVNRVLQALRADGLNETKSARVNIPDWEKLKQAGDFDPTHLHLEQEQAAA